MIKADMEFFTRVKDGLSACPRLNTGWGGPTQTVGAISKAYDDFSEINRMASVAMQKYLFYLEGKKNFKDADDEYIAWIEGEKESAYEFLQELEAYVKERNTSNWN